MFFAYRIFSLCVQEQLKSGTLAVDKSWRCYQKGKTGKRKSIGCTAWFSWKLRRNTNTCSSLCSTTERSKWSSCLLLDHRHFLIYFNPWNSWPFSYITNRARKLLQALVLISIPHRPCVWTHMNGAWGREYTGDSRELGDHRSSSILQPLL